MKKNIETILIRWLGKSKTPPIKFWKLFADKNDIAKFPPRGKWEHIWKEFIKIYSSNKFLICNSSEKQLNLPAVKSYFKVEWNKSRITGREPVSAFEDKWWNFSKKLMPGKRVLRHINLPECGMHLDIFCPDVMVALEVQGEQHWRPIEIFGGIRKFAERQERDARKRNICSMLGIKLIEVSSYTTIFDIMEKFEHLKCSNAQ